MLFRSGTSNALDFLPLDRSGNRRFIPVMVYPEQAEVHILEDEAASRAYLAQVWAEAMTVYRSGDFKLSFSPEMVRYLKEHQRDFMPEAGSQWLLLHSQLSDRGRRHQLRPYRNDAYRQICPEPFVHDAGTGRHRSVGGVGTVDDPVVLM